MRSCERCWRDAGIEAFSTQGEKVEIYSRMIDERECTPEEQAGPEARDCPRCKRRTVHQHCGICMACGYKRMEVVVDA